MKTDPQRDELLHDLVSESTAQVPTLDSLLKDVRTERRRRRNLAIASATLSVLALITITLTFPKEPPVQQAVSVSQVTPEPFAIKHINDQELLDLLAGQPVALFESPNGERGLLMITPEKNQNGGTE
jgi:hypothetical protein